MRASLLFMPHGRSPYRMLALAILCAVVLAQVAGMVMLARSQVQKAEQRAIAERSVRWEAIHCTTSATGTESAACRLRAGAAAAADGLMTASYASPR